MITIHTDICLYTGSQHLDHQNICSSSPTKIHNVFILPADKVANYEARTPPPFAPQWYTIHNANPYMQAAGWAINLIYNTQLEAGPSDGPFTMYDSQAGLLAALMYNVQATTSGPLNDPFGTHGRNNSHTSFYYTN